MADLPFREGESGPFGVGGVGEEGQDSGVAIGGEAVQVGGLPGGGGGVNLEVSGVDENSHGSGQGKADPVDDAVGDPDEIKGKGPQSKFLLGMDGMELDVFQELMFFEFFPEEGQGQGGTVNGQIIFAQEKGHRADMVFVAMGKDQRQNLFPAVSQVGEIRDHHIYAQHVVFGEHDAGINEDQAVIGLEDHSIETDFPQAAEEDEVNPVVSP